LIFPTFWQQDADPTKCKAVAVQHDSRFLTRHHLH